MIFILREQHNTINHKQMNTIGRLPEMHVTHWLAACKMAASYGSRKTFEMWWVGAYYMQCKHRGSVLDTC